MTTPEEIDALRAEVEQLRADAEGARGAAREAEAAAGELRGTIEEMQVQLARARQDQERYQGALSLVRSGKDRLAIVKRRVLRRG